MPGRGGGVVGWYNHTLPCGARITTRKGGRGRLRGWLLWCGPSRLGSDLAAKFAKIAWKLSEIAAVQIQSDRLRKTPAYNQSSQACQACQVGAVELWVGPITHCHAGFASPRGRAGEAACVAGCCGAAQVGLGSEGGFSRKSALAKIAWEPVRSHIGYSLLVALTWRSLLVAMS
jgi:hypothetical protein